MYIILVGVFFLTFSSDKYSTIISNYKNNRQNIIHWIYVSFEYIIKVVLAVSSPMVHVNLLSVVVRIGEYTSPMGDSTLKLTTKTFSWNWTQNVQGCPKNNCYDRKIKEKESFIFKIIIIFFPSTCTNNLKNIFSLMHITNLISVVLI